MRCLLSVFLLILASINLAAQSSVNKPGADDRVIIKSKRIVLVRSGKWAEEFPERKRAVVVYPVITGLNDRAALRRVRSILNLKNIFGSSLDDYRQDGWLREFNYRVHYNRNYILDITFAQSGMGAYPDSQTRHFAINLKNGRIIKASEVFATDNLKTLASLIDVRLQTELKQIARENAGIGSGIEAKQLEQIVESSGELKFKVKNLDEFSVDSRGITFLFDAGFPHVIKAFEPRGRYFFTYSELKPYIKRDSPLGQFIIQG